MTLLAIDHLTVSHGDQIALRGVSLRVAAGEIVGLVGESGSGKSTVALASMALLPDTAAISGQVVLDGANLVTLPPRQLDRLRGNVAGMIFQEPMSALNPLQTIGTQVAEVIRLHKGLGRRTALREAGGVLARVGLLPDRVPASRYPHQLSGGQRQRVAIAIAIAGDPKLIVADEPTTALDVTTQAHIMDLLTGLIRERGIGLLLVSHDLALVGQVADRIVVLQDGTIVEQGPVGSVLAAPRGLYTRMLLAKARHVPARRIGPSVGAPVLEVRDLTQRYRGAKAAALDGVSLRVGPGETVGVIGESGSGKTTLLRAVLALGSLQAGAVLLHGEAIATARGHRLRVLRRQVQAVFQDPKGSFDPRQRVEQLVAEPLHLLDVPVARAERRERVETALRRVGLDAADADRFPHQFSGGQRQRIAIARALIIEPSLVVLDEAVSALDMSTRADILDLLATLSATLGLSYLFVSHDLSVMKSMADRLIVMKDGRIVEEGPTATILATPRHPYTTALVAATPDLDRVIASRTAQA